MLFIAYDEVDIFGSNGETYSKQQITNPLNKTTYDNLIVEKWLEDLTPNNAKINYVSNYESQQLKKAYPDALFYLIRVMTNLNSGRKIGILNIKLRDDILNNISNKMLSKDQKIVLMDKNGIHILYRSFVIFYGRKQKILCWK